MNLLTFVIACKARLSFLQQSLPSVMRLPNVQCVLVDYDCPQKCGDWVEATYPQVRVVRVADRPRYFRAEARNVGAAAVATPWMCITDADIVFDPGFAEVVIPLLRPDVYLTPPQTPGIAGTVVCARADFVRVGGYDEVIKDWGYEDSDFYETLQYFRVKEVPLPTNLLSHIVHADGLRTEFHDNKDIANSWVTNRLYSFLKLSLMEGLQQTLSVPTRQKLYDWALQARTQFAQGQSVPLLQVGLNSTELGDACPFLVKKVLGFSLEKRPGGR